MKLHGKAPPRRKHACMSEEVGTITLKAETPDDALLLASLWRLLMQGHDEGLAPVKFLVPMINRETGEERFTVERNEEVNDA